MSTSTYVIWEHEILPGACSLAPMAGFPEAWKVKQGAVDEAIGVRIPPARRRSPAWRREQGRLSDSERPMEPLRIEFGVAEAGWLPVRVITLESAVDFEVSDVPNDFLAELAQALAAFVAAGEGVAIHHEEPAGVRWTLRTRRGLGELRLRRFTNLDAAIDDVGPSRVVCSARMPASALARALLRDLRALVRERARCLPEGEWPYDPPGAQLDAIAAALDADRGRGDM